MATITVAVPSDNPGGLEAGIGAHFGRCDVYTIVETDGSAICSVTTMENGPHGEGGCLAPVSRLAEAGVNALLAGGMGMRPLEGFRGQGIDVFFSGGHSTVETAVTAFLQGKLSAFSSERSCSCSH